MPDTHYPAEKTPFLCVISLASYRRVNTSQSDQAFSMITQDGYVTATCSADVTTRYLTGYFIIKTPVDWNSN